MAETYKTVNDDTLEVTSTQTRQIKKRDLENEKRMFEDEIERAKKQIAEVDEKLAIFKESKESI